MVPWCLFDFTIREVSNTNIALRHLLLEAIAKNLKKKKLYLIAKTDLRFKALAIYNIKNMAKFNSLTH